MKRIILAATIAVSTLAGQALAEQYVCETEQSTGFSYEGNGRWTQARFADGDQFLIDTDAMIVSQFGQGGSFYDGDDCVLLGGNSPEYMRCLPNDKVFGMTFGISSMRFVLTSHGYANGDGDGRNDPAVAIGTCAELGS